MLLVPLGWIAHTEYNKYNGSVSPVQKNSTASSKIKDNEAGKTSTINNNKTIDNNTVTNNTPAEKNTIVASHVGQSQQTSIAHYKTTNEPSLKQNTISSPQQPTVLNQQQVALQNESTNNTSSQSPVNNQTVNSSSVQTNNLANSNNNITSNTIASTATTQVSAKKSSSIKIKSNGHYFYAGLAAGVDLSFVKYQQIQPLGYNIGLLVGYKFNKLSIESGLLLAKKNYYTDGEYFDKSKIPFFNNAELLSVNGYCRMYEIPLNVKYDFASRKRHTWFASAGLSSYLMNKEYYNYSYKQNGIEQSGSYPYFHTTQDWFSVLNISGGYQLQTGTKTNLRIEPYFKATLSGVGTGSLPISSAGLNVGLVRQIP